MREDVCAVRELVHCADKANGSNDMSHLFIADRCREGIREPLGVDHAVWAVVVVSWRWVEWIGDGERILHSRYCFIGFRKPFIAFLP